MSKDDRFDNEEWQLGMPLPSRKEKHKRKKSMFGGGGRKQKDEAPATDLPRPPAESRVETAVDIPAPDSSPAPPAPPSAPAAPQKKPVPQDTIILTARDNVQAALREVVEVPKVSAPVYEGIAEEKQQAPAVFEAVPEREEYRATPQVPQTAEPLSPIDAVPVREEFRAPAEPHQAEETHQTDVSLSSAETAVQPEPDLPADERGSTDPQVLAAEAEAARQEIEAGQQEAASTVALPLLDPEVVSQEERDMLLEDQDEEGGSLSRWQRIMILTLTPIALVVVLLWGKLGYVHNVPDLVRDNVPAYKQGAGFLIIKPWWFGPPTFSLDEYMQGDVHSFGRFKIKMGDYSEVVIEPTVIYTFAEDIMN